MMTCRDAESTARVLLGDFRPEIDYDTYVRHMKLATQKLCSESPVYTRRHDITLTAASEYSLAGKRVGRLHAAVSIDGTVVTPVSLDRQEYFHRVFQTTSGGGGRRVTNICRDGDNTIRVWPPSATGGTLRLFHSPVPVLARRDSIKPGEVVSAATPTTVTVTSLSLGKVNNNAGSTNHFDDCILLFLDGPAIGQSAVVTDYDEGAVTSTFMLASALSAIPVATNKFEILDVLETTDEFAGACIDFVGSRIGMMDKKKLGNLPEQLRQDWLDWLNIARDRSFDIDPGTEIRFGPHGERLAADPLYG